MLMHFPAAVRVTPTLVKCSFLIVICSGMRLQGEVKKPCFVTKACSTSQAVQRIGHGQELLHACLFLWRGEEESRGPSPHDNLLRFIFN